MAATIHGAQILTQAGVSVLDRVQSAGPGDVSISRDKIYELGNDKSIGTTTGVPEVSYSVESFDVSCEFECRLIGENPATFPTTPGTNEIDFKDALPIDMLSIFKTRKNSDTVETGVISPYLALSSVSYSFGVGDNASQSFSLNGDTELLTPGQPYYAEIVNTGTGPYTIPRTADKYNDSGRDVYILSVMLKDSVTKAYKRVFFDQAGVTGYTNTSTTFTLPAAEQATYDTICITYSSSTKVNYDDDGVGPNGQTVHEGLLVKPAAVQAKDLDVYIGTNDATPVFTRMISVQNIQATWSVTMENGEELGNNRFTYTEYDVPDVSGSIGIKPISVADLADKFSRVTGVPAAEVIGPNSSVPVPLEMRVRHPDTGVVLKTIYIPDARFDIPGFTGQVNSRLENTLNFTSDTGEMFVYNGARV